MMVDSDPAASQPEQQFLLQQLQLLSSSGHRGSGSPQGNPPDVPRFRGEDHGERAVKKLQATVQSGKTTRK